MSLQAFNKLVSILSPLLKRNDVYSCASAPISPIIEVGIGIWYMAGGELVDIRHVFGVSIAEAYNCIECFLEMILCCESMRIMLPRNPEEWDSVSARFAKVTRDELFGGCVSAVLLLLPTSMGSGRKDSYVSICL